MKSKVINNLTPYNFDSFGESDHCMLVAYYSALNYFKYDLNIIFANSLLKIELFNNVVSVTNYRQDNYFYQLHQKYSINIGQLKTILKRDYINKIRYELLNGNLVFTPVFSPKSYDPVTKEVTESFDSKHYCLIFGFDDKKKEFDVVNHLKNTSLVYKNCKIKYKNLRKAHYKANLANVDDNEMYIVSPPKKSINYSQKELNDTYNRLVLINREMVENNYYIIMNYISKINSSQLMMSVADSIASFIYYFNHEVLVLKTIQSEYLDEGSEILKHLKLLRTCIFRTVYSKNEEMIYRFNNEKEFLIKNIKHYFKCKYGVK